MKLLLRPEWGSRNANHRQSIREDIAQCTGENSVLDLDHVPKPKSQYVSIAHCPSTGGYAVGPKPIGLDVEEIARIKPELVARISSLDEFGVAPTAAHLWVAKEAIYKALAHFTQPLTVTQIEVGWKDEESFFCVNAKQFNLPHPGTGRAQLQDDLIIAVFEI